ncbi:MAG: acyltransferase 3, partial [Acidimicrobiia bacterium]|nr:acyltransferase 3 [Acidimicrobiia bacterium]
MTPVIGRAKRGASGYVPALDGLRAVAVAAVLCFHHGFAWATGGYLGVSLFFTLSGYLIASLLLQEKQRTGRIGLGAFWARRARRILPAAAVGIAGVWIALHWVDLGPVGVIRLDAVAALVYVLNWRLLFGHQSYAQLFSAPSPLLHYWSLAIEEQFYLVIAPLFVLMLRWRRAALTAVCAAIYLGGAVVAVVAGPRGDTDFVYYSTITRLPELMIGVLAALVVHRHDGAGITWRPARLAVLNGGSVVAVAALAYAVVQLVPSDPFLNHGGLLLLSMASVTLVLAATCADTWLARALGRGPLPLVGRLSYGLYVVHWPIFLIVNADRTGLMSLPLFALRVCISAAAAVALTQLLEAPLRRYLRSPRLVGLAAVPVTALLALVLLIGPSPVGAGAVAASAFTPPLPTHVAPVTTSGAGVAPTPNAPPPIPVGMFGDSTALRTAWGLGGWGSDTGRLDFVGGSAVVACGLGRGGEH